jgi:hypothetical protein
MPRFVVETVQFLPNVIYLICYPSMLKGVYTRASIGYDVAEIGVDISEKNLVASE